MRCVLLVVCCLLFAVGWLMSNLLIAECWWLSVGCCKLFVVRCCLLCVVGGLLLVVVVRYVLLVVCLVSCVVC